MRGANGYGSTDDPRGLGLIGDDGGGGGGADEDEGGMVTGGRGSSETIGPRNHARSVKRLRRKDRLNSDHQRQRRPQPGRVAEEDEEEEDSSDLSDESDEDGDAHQRYVDPGDLLVLTTVIDPFQERRSRSSFLKCQFAYELDHRLFALGIGVTGRRLRLLLLPFQKNPAVITVPGLLELRSMKI